MRKKVVKLIIILVFILSLTSCNDFNLFNKDDNTTNSMNASVVSKDEYLVTYICDNGIIKTQETKNKKAYNLEPSVNKYQKFLCWCTDFELNNEFNFNTKLNTDLTLYAKYDIDYISLTNDISLKYMVYSVKLECSFKTIGFNSSTYLKIGSGVIINEDDTYYYALTNNHVIAKPDGYIQSSYTVKDCFENEYAATLLYNLNTYDLALVKFKKDSNVQLAVIKLADSQPHNNETIISLGSPSGQDNCLTYGKYLKNIVFEPILESKDISDVEFEVITHSAPITNGSSGGPIINTNLELVGINFASSTTKNGEFLYAYAIPIEKVKEFIQEAQI